MIDRILLAILLFCMGLLFGRVMAHEEVATECQRLNSFYVGTTVYHCEVKK